MNNLLRGILLGAVIGGIIGWMLRDGEQKRREEGTSKAYTNDPEVISLRNEYSLMNQLDEVMDSMAVDDGT